MWCIIIPFLTAIIGAFLGWLLRYFICKHHREQDKEELASVLSENENLKQQLQTCLKNKQDLIVSKSNLEADYNHLVTANNLNKGEGVLEKEPTLLFNANTAKQFIGKKVVADNLTVVEGIGPKIAELFGEHGVKTWYKLSITSVEKCQEILDAGGPRFRIHKPDTWPKQALLAFEGKWQELSAWQEELDGGKYNTDI